jgi:phosphoenolpyruvate synthase/pyruvate phosphate dikinase
MNHFVLSLTAPEVTLATAGGKGANLQKLLAGGFPVPSGFVVTTEAYRAFVDANALAGLISEITATTEPTDPDSFERASQVIRAQFGQADLSPDIRHAIEQAYADLGRAERTSDVPVAVRSSATAEDLPEASFAGQQETHLNIRGAVAVVKAVQRCWSSLWTARAPLPIAPATWNALRRKAWRWRW